MMLGVIQARVSSTRLPRKVLLPLLGRPMLAFQLERVARSLTLDKVVVATSTDPSDDELEALCADAGVECFRGPLDDVLLRFVQAAEHFQADHVVRMTGDCPLSDPDIIDAAVRMHLEGGYHYTSNCSPSTFPDGLDVEVIRSESLARAGREARKASEREHVTVWVRGHTEPRLCGNLVHTPDLSALRWTVDEPADLAFVRTVCAELASSQRNFGMDEVLALLEKHPEYSTINAGIERNEGLAKSIREDALHPPERPGEV